MSVNGDPTPSIPKCSTIREPTKSNSGQSKNYIGNQLCNFFCVTKAAPPPIEGVIFEFDIFAQIRNYCSMSKNQVQDTANMLKALGEFNRLSLVYELCQCQSPQNAMCLCECCDVDASVVSRHLKILAQEGIVQFERKGRERTYSLNRSELAESLRNLADKIEGKK